MALIEINKDPSPRELRWFGLIFLVFFGIVGGVVYTSASALWVATAIWAGAAMVALLYYAVPVVQRPIYLGWSYAALPIGWTVSHLVLAVIYYAVVTPIALLMRLRGRDPMTRKFDRSASSYWLERRSGDDPSRYFRQF